MNETGPPTPARSISDAIRQNIEAIATLQAREAAQIPAYQRRLERVSRFLGRPAYFVTVLVIGVVWMVYNVSAPPLRLAAFDPPPFPFLEFLLSFVALATTTIVLIGQNRESRLEQYRSHLDLQVNLLTELKVTKLIHLLEELRRDLPVRDRRDAQAEALQEAADATELITALDDLGLTGPDTDTSVQKSAQ